MLFQIKSIHFTAGGTLAETKKMSGSYWTVDKAAPIIGYMVGWTEADAKAYCQKKGWYYEEVEGTKKSLDKD